MTLKMFSQLFPHELGLATKDVDGSRLRLICVGVKGDWPFLRKAARLGLHWHIFFQKNTWGDFI